MATTPRPLPPRPDTAEVNNALAGVVTREPPVDVDAVPSGDAAMPPPDMGTIGGGRRRRTPAFDVMPQPGDPDDDDKVPPTDMVSDEDIRKEILERWGADFAQKRIPFGASGRRLPSHKKRPGFHYHIFNDHPGRIEAALRAGYKHVTDEKGRPISTVVGVSQFGDAQTGYLMEIPEEWFRADMAAAQKEVDEVDQVILGGKVGAKEGHGRYAAGIKVDRAE